MTPPLLEHRHRRVVNVAVGLAVGCCAAAVAYSAIRAIQYFFYPAPDPRTVLVVSRIAFFWRGWIAALVGVLATIGASGLRRRGPAQLDGMLPAIVVSTIIVTAAQGVLIP